MNTHRFLVRYKIKVLKTFFKNTNRVNALVLSITTRRPRDSLMSLHCGSVWLGVGVWPAANDPFQEYPLRTLPWRCYGWPGAPQPVVWSMLTKSHLISCMLLHFFFGCFGYFASCQYWWCGVVVCVSFDFGGEVSRCMEAVFVGEDAGGVALKPNKCLLRPKSPIFISLPSSLANIFAGFKSRWMIPFEWTWAKPLTSCLKISRAGPTL